MRPGKRRAGRAVWASMLVLATACGEAGEPFVHRTPAERLGTCVAVRGNGDRILSSLYGLARLVELYGPLGALSGSSSGSAAAFLYESMLLNPGLQDCGGRPCDREQQGRRVALLLKSVEGLLAAKARSNEIRALMGIRAWYTELRERGFSAGAVPGTVAAALKLAYVIASPSVRGLVAPDVLRDLLTPWRTRATLEEIQQAVRTDPFAAADATVLLRRGILSMEKVVEHVGRTGNLYAGRGPTSREAWIAFHEACADRGVGRTWKEFAHEAFESHGIHASCHERFAALLPSRLARWLARPSHRDRLDDRVGAGLPAVISTSMLVGDTAAAALAAARAHQEGAPHPFAPDFADVRVGYWGDPERIARILEHGPARFGDRKSQMMHDLGSVDWRTAMLHSMTEPGLGPVLDYAQERPGVVTSGGWLDNHAVMALDAAGCDTVLYVSRRGPDSIFGRRMAGLLGATEAEQDELFEVNDPASSFSVALREASGVWCTDWNSYGLGDVQGLIQDGYRAPFQINDAALVDGARPHPGASQETGLLGCQYGIRAETN